MDRAEWGPTRVPAANTGRTRAGHRGRGLPADARAVLAGPLRRDRQPLQPAHHRGAAPEPDSALA
eukprot:8493548-Lingulodinium_polyedra.AAC.1